MAASKFSRDYILEEILLLNRPRDAVAVMGFTDRDLWPGEDWGYVFGQASFRARVGIHSFHRYGHPSADDEAYQLCLERTLKVALHEAGHMFGLAHCRDAECSMNAANHLAELDRNQLGYCPECEQKVWWSCRTPISSRYENLVEFARANRLVDAESLWQASLERLERASE